MTSSQPLGRPAVNQEERVPKSLEATSSCFSSSSTSSGSLP